MKPSVWTTVYVLTMLTVALVGMALAAADSGLRAWAVTGAAAALTTAGSAAALVVATLRGHGDA